MTINAGGHGGPLPLVIGPCPHGEIACAPVHHATCRHCTGEIHRIQSWGTMLWLHANGGLACPTTHAEPGDVIGSVSETGHKDDE